MVKKQFYNRDILKVLHDRYGCSLDYIRKSIRGDRVGNVSKLIKKEYNKLNNEVIKVVNLESEKL